MKISKFKLVDNGRGIEVDSIELSRKSGLLIVDGIKRTRKIPVNDEVKSAVDNLKYSFLNLTGHWMPPFTGYIDDERVFIRKLSEVKGGNDRTYELVTKLWDHTRINGAVIRDGAFMILGQIEVLDGKTISINTPLVREDDDFHFYNETIDRIEIAEEAIIRFLTSDKLLIQDSTKFLLDFYKNDKDHTIRIKEQNEKENFDEMIGLLATTGSIKYDDGKALPASTTKTDTIVHKSKGTIDEDAYKNAEVGDTPTDPNLPTGGTLDLADQEDKW